MPAIDDLKSPPKVRPAAGPSRGTPVMPRHFSGKGEPFVWLCGAALSACLLMIFGLLGIVLFHGADFFWPHRLVSAGVANDGKILGIHIRTEQFRKFSGTNQTVTVKTRSQFKLGNRDLTGADFRWIEHSELSPWEYPREAAVFEREEYGDFIGILRAVKENGNIVAEGESAWVALRQRHSTARALAAERRALQKHAMGEVNSELQDLQYGIQRANRLLKGEELDAALARSKEKQEELAARFSSLKERTAELEKQAGQMSMLVASIDGREKEIPLLEVVRAYQPNAMSFLQKVGHYIAKVWEFVSDEPRESNTEGGIFPAIFGTVMMTVLMSLAVVPFGVLAAIYLREYARQGPFVRLVRIAVNNLAGVPSIVFGVFGLGFFVYFLGGSIDSLFFAERLPTPTWGTGGILWASLTLALLTVPVVIVATEESIAAVPRGAKEGSLALGASRFQTLCRIILPASLPGILTGLILAMARGAGEVAPLMITGVVKLAPNLPLDGQFPYLHLDRKFMHLGFHIYDVGFQSPNVEAAKPMVFTTTLLLLLVVVALNLSAILIRDRIRKRYRTGAFA
jgi:phosphate transport system permease protein